MFNWFSENKKEKVLRIKKKEKVVLDRFKLTYTSNSFDIPEIVEKVKEKPKTIKDLIKKKQPKGLFGNGKK